MLADPIQTLRDHGIQPSAQRVEVARYVLDTDEHPSADRVWEVVRERQPTISRATIYNTLNLFVEHGLLRTLLLSEGHVVFDPKTNRHHHFVDEATGRIVDVPWDALDVGRIDELPFEVADYQVVLRGRLS
ncbi:MAG: transcriptional repressor [Proteobacteria bacterium]|nr:transcriptional repressor [Pseudomonadota bacterium]